MRINALIIKHVRVFKTVTITIEQRNFEVSKFGYGQASLFTALLLQHSIVTLFQQLSHKLIFEQLKLFKK